MVFVEEGIVISVILDGEKVVYCIVDGMDYVIIVFEDVCVIEFLLV